MGIRVSCPMRVSVSRWILLPQVAMLRVAPGDADELSPVDTTWRNACPLRARQRSRAEPAADCR